MSSRCREQRAGRAQLEWHEELELRVKSGRHVWGVDMRIVDDQGKPLPEDGKAFGNLQVAFALRTCAGEWGRLLSARWAQIRGPWVVHRYFKNAGGDITDADNWFTTGDVATIDADGEPEATRPPRLIQRSTADEGARTCAGYMLITDRAKV